MPGAGKRIFGYRVITPEAGREHTLVCAFIALGISAEGMSDGRFAISEWDYRRFRAYAGGRVRYTAGERMGLYGLICRNLYRFPMLIALALGIAFNLFLSGIVWDVRVRGNETLDSDVVVEGLLDAGFGVGSLWSRLDAEYVETALLSSLSDVAWVQINRRGTVAYVEIRERANVPPPAPPAYKCSNIVADRDCVIEEITVESGRALVKPGDVVRRGDILISGIMETEGGTVIGRAEGHVLAHAVGKTEYIASRKTEITEYGRGAVCERGVRVFGIKINIYKNYGNLDTDYDIIENEKEFVSPDGKVLPFALYESYVNIPITYVREYAESDLPEVASLGLFTALEAELRGKDLIKLHTSGGYTEDGYSMIAEYVYSCEVGSEIEILLGDING